MTSVWGGLPGKRERRGVFSTTMSIVNLKFKLLFWLIYKMSFVCASGPSATFPKATDML